MDNQKQENNFAAIRKLLNQLTEDDFKNLVVDHFQDARSQLDGSLSNKIQKLLDYAQKHRQIQKLLDAVKEINPGAYSEYENETNQQKKEPLASKPITNDFKREQQSQRGPTPRDESDYSPGLQKDKQDRIDVHLEEANKPMRSYSSHLRNGIDNAERLLKQLGDRYHDPKSFKISKKDSEKIKEVMVRMESSIIRAQEAGYKITDDTRLDQFLKDKLEAQNIVKNYPEILQAAKPTIESGGSEIWSAEYVPTLKVIEREAHSQDELKSKRAANG